jgi:peptidyl-prolyl cis-trans isomerase B (cyclophilin B)
MKKVIKLLVLLSLLSLILIGCSSKDSNDSTEDNSVSSEGESTDTTGETNNTENEADQADTETVEESTGKGTGLQFEQPQKGETIAEIVVKDFGSIHIRFFSDQAPKAVENFITHAKEGYYNGLIFHRVMSEFMIQGGDPTGTGYAGESIWGEAFEDEFTDELSPYRGALCMANSGPDTNGSQFFIVQAHTVTQDDLDYFEENGFKFSDEQKENYLNVGGTPWLYQQHTVFGQMYDGYDVLDKIAAVETDENDKPTSDVIIEKINIIEY